MEGDRDNAGVLSCAFQQNRKAGKLVKPNFVGLVLLSSGFGIPGWEKVSLICFGSGAHSLGKGARGTSVDRPIKTVCSRGGGAGKNDSPQEECVVTPQKGHRCCAG